MRIAGSVLVIALACTSGARAQAPAFEVANVKENHSGSGRSSSPWLINGRMTAENATLRMILRVAYGLTALQIEGPGPQPRPRAASSEAGFFQPALTHPAVPTHRQCRANAAWDPSPDTCRAAAAPSPESRPSAVPPESPSPESRKCLRRRTAFARRPSHRTRHRRPRYRLAYRPLWPFILLPRRVLYRTGDVIRDPG
jgi:hypothetical protein